MELTTDKEYFDAIYFCCLNENSVDDNSKNANVTDFLHARNEVQYVWIWVDTNMEGESILYHENAYPEIDDYIQYTGAKYGINHPR